MVGLAACPLTHRQGPGKRDDVTDVPSIEAKNLAVGHKIFIGGAWRKVTRINYKSQEYWFTIHAVTDRGDQKMFNERDSVRVWCLAPGSETTT